MKKLILILCSVLALVACDGEDQERYQSEVDRAQQKVAQMNRVKTPELAPKLTDQALTKLASARSLADQGFFTEAKPELDSFYVLADQAIDKALNSQKSKQEELARLEAEKKAKEQALLEAQRQAAEKAAKKTYVVKQGDWLRKIARNSDNDVSWKDIYEANQDQISNPDFIEPGQVLKVPNKK